MILSLCFFAVMTLAPEPFYLKENLYRQFPLYCFLERNAVQVRKREDPETGEKIIAANSEYIAGQVLNENNKNEQRILQEDSQQEGTDLESERKVTEKTDAEIEPDISEEAEQEPETGISEETDLESGTVVPGNTDSVSEESSPHPEVDLSPESLADYDYLLGQFFILDSNTATSPEQLNAARFLEEDLTIDKNALQPQILIYHSHSQETFADSREGVPEDTIVGVGTCLSNILTEKYGYNVIHATETFDIIDGEVDRSRAYDFAREYVEQVLAENPSIEVVIDLHRDGVPDDRHLVTEINGKDTAQIMFYNGLSYTVNNGPVEYLPNPYIQDNLAFSFQLEYQAAMYYPDFYRGIYLAGLRYNLHLLPKTLLLEAGAQNNTIQEVKNAMEPFADILNKVLCGTGEIW